MKILDFHIHVGRSTHLIPKMIEHLRETMGEAALQLLDKLTTESFLHFLSMEGVDQGVLLADYSPKVTGEVPNDFVKEFCGSSGTLIPFASIKFSSSVEPAAQVESAVVELGCRGVKLLPSYAHFYPDDPRILPVYESAQSLEIPVMFHTGTSLFPGTRIKYAHPLLLDEIAENFSRLSIVMSHGGRPFWYKEAEWLLMRHKNMYIDISGIPARQLKTNFPKIEKLSDRFIFGSDWPNIPSIKAQASKIMEQKFSETFLKKLFWENGMRLVGGA